MPADALNCIVRLADWKQNVKKTPSLFHIQDTQGTSGSQTLEMLTKGGVICQQARYQLWRRCTVRAVMLRLSAALRDEKRFADPEVLDEEFSGLRANEL